MAHGRVVIVPRAKLFSPLTALAGSGDGVALGDAVALAAGDAESLGDGDAAGDASLGAGDPLGAAATTDGDGVLLGAGAPDGAALGDVDGSALDDADGAANDGDGALVGDTALVAVNSGIAVSASNVAVASPGCVIGTNTNSPVGVVVVVLLSAALAEGELVICAGTVGV